MTAHDRKISASARWRLCWIMLCLASSAAAHDYWFEPDANGDVLMFRGHRYSDHEGVAIEPYDPSAIESASCMRTGANAPENSFPSNYPMRLPADCAALFVSLDAGIWTRTPHGIVSFPKEEYSDAVESWRAVESIKLITSWDSDLLTEPLSNKLEITPRGDPFSLEPGDKIRLQLTLNGLPVSGAAVAYHGNFRGMTDRDGRINIRIRHRGLQVIAASFEERLEDGEADRLVRSAVLQFELP